MQTRTLRVIPPSASLAPAPMQVASSAGALAPVAQSAVEAKAASLASSTLRVGADPRFGGGVSLFDPRAAGYQDPILASANAGTGSKLKIASAVGLHEVVGMDVVASACNLLLAHGAEPVSFHYHVSCGAIDVAISDRVVAGMAEACRQSGAVLAGGRSVEMPGVFEDGEYDLSGHATGLCERIGLLPRFDCAEGDVLLALAASGPHAHGYGLIRRILTSEGIAYRDIAPFAPAMTVGQALMQPTRCYAPVVGAVLRATPAIKAIAPIADGGLLGSMTRALPAQLAARIDLTSWRMPPVFQWLRRAGNLPDADMVRAFDCGLGMVLVIDKLRTVSALKVLRDLGEKPLAIGTLVNRSGGDAVRFSGGLPI